MMRVFLKVFVFVSILLTFLSFPLFPQGKGNIESLPQSEPVTNDNFPKGSFSFSPDGKKIALSMCDKGKSARFYIYVVNLGTGASQKMTNIPGEYPSWSPDGRKIVFSSFNMESFTSKIYIVNQDGSNLRDIGREGYNPSWSPCGNLIALTYQHNIWTINIDGSNLKFLTMEDYNDYPSWSPDCKKIVFSSDGSIVMVNVRTGFIKDVLTERAWAGYPVFSPDGGKIAFVSNRDGEYDIWIIDLDSKTLKKVTQDKARESYLQWGQDGYIYYLREENKIYNIWRVKIEE